MLWLLLICCASHCVGLRDSLRLRPPRIATAIRPLFAHAPLTEVKVATSTGAATVLKCDSLSKSYTGSPQFSSVSFNLARGQKVGLIGLNGAGKSTFLKCLAGIESPDSGSVESATGSSVVYVEQDPIWKDICVYEGLFSGPSAAAVATRKYYALMQNESDFDSDGFAKISDQMETSGGWAYQERGLSLAQNLNIPESFAYRSVASLSGGQRKRVALAAALLKQPDVLLLDEVY
jgi:ATPase subunit of ABC transporter with duplicated ATPase domains